jgi:hypothetical protein
MSQKINTAEGGVDSTSVSAAGSGGTSGSAFDSVSVTGSASLLYKATSASHGSMGMLATITASGENAAAVMKSAAATAVQSGQFTSKGLTAYPSSGITPIFVLRDSAGAQVAGLGVDNLGKLHPLNKTGSSLATSGYILPLNTPFRGQVQGTPGSTTANGRVQARVTLNESTQPVYKYDSGFAVNAGTVAVQFCRAGIIAGTVAWSVSIDDVLLDDAGTFPLAPVGTITDTVNAGSDQSGVAAGSTVTLTATASSGAVDWSQVSGATVTITPSTTNPLVATFVAPTSGAGTVVLRATNGTATDDVSIAYLGTSATVNAGTDQTGLAPGATATLTATSSTGSVTWTQTSGSPVSLLGSGALTRTFVVPSDYVGGTLVFQADNGTVQDSVNVSYTAVPYVANNAEGGTEGTTVTSGNSGGASGTAFAPAFGGAALITFEAAAASHGGFGYHLHTENSGESAFMSTTLATAIAVASGRMTSKGIAAFPPDKTSIMRWRDTASVIALDLYLLPDGSFQLYSGNGGAGGEVLVWSSTYRLPLNTPFRIEGMAAENTGSNGRARIAIYEYEQTAAKDGFDTGAIAGAGTNAALSQFRFGISAGLGAWDLPIDDLFVDKIGSFPIGPVATPGADLVNAGADQTDIDPYAVVTLLATSSSGTVTWTQISGPTVVITPSSTNPLLATFPAPRLAAGATVVIQAVNGAATDNITIGVDPVTDFVVTAAGTTPTVGSSKVSKK